MQFIDEYVAGFKNPKSVEYPHAIYKDVAGDTFGVLVYQEQIMALVQKMSGFTLGQADVLRRGIGKKIQKYLVEGRQQFVDGAKNINNVDEETSNKIYDTIIKFADYGFNKAHSVAYALISYQTAYLKANYPLEYMCACLNINSNNTSDDNNKLAATIAETKRMGIELLTPEFGKSSYDFKPEGESIRFGYRGIKASGERVTKVLENIKDASSLQEIIVQLPVESLRLNALTNLVDAGVFEKFGTRYAINKMLPSLVEYAKICNFDREHHVKSLFEYLVEKAPENLTEYPSLSKLSRERKVIQCNLSGHPVQEIRPSLGDEKTNSICVVKDNAENDEVVKLAVLIDDFRKIMTKKMTEMALIQISDETGDIDAVIFPREYSKLKDELQKCYKQTALIEAQVQIKTDETTEEEVVSLIINKITAIRTSKMKAFINKDMFTAEIEEDFKLNNGVVELIIVDVNTLEYDVLEYKTSLETIKKYSFGNGIVLKK